MDHGVLPGDEESKLSTSTHTGSDLRSSGCGRQGAHLWFEMKVLCLHGLHDQTSELFIHNDSDEGVGFSCCLLRVEEFRNNNLLKVFCLLIEGTTRKGRREEEEDRGSSVRCVLFFLPQLQAFVGRRGLMRDHSSSGIVRSCTHR